MTPTVITAARQLGAIGTFTHFALDMLWRSTPDAMPDDLPADDQRREDYLGCCPRCCGPCEALFTLLDDGLLEEWVLLRGHDLTGTSWWNPDRHEVDRVWLKRAWGGADTLGCHPAEPGRASFRCPRCGRVSSHPQDVEQGYCGNCHDWTGGEAWTLGL